MSVAGYSRDRFLACLHREDALSAGRFSVVDDMRIYELARPGNQSFSDVCCHILRTSLVAPMKEEVDHLGASEHKG